MIDDIRPTDSGDQSLGYPGDPERVAGARGSEYELYEQNGEFVLSIELPGFDREEIDLHLDGGYLTVAAEHDADRPERQRRYDRKFRLPAGVEDDGITARYRRGILDVFIPTDQDSALPGKEIPVQT